ncbi:Very-long-chain (3R)-3-hydroxyacyl-CoA dehydratase [Pleurostoma richardsiae]|uniref:Very-long-chain (3R)-3-hydroxyacyl-CoA dehydratase n=1 Tax=Pleurostoma richardsiae TaxID=41990 RepID=A0AA38VNE4_9PEZI|nr:Very-long-chain (3R)-3-hydroxyacyl-CoA dehydratase [Pleurostoma richardsiae]
MAETTTEPTRAPKQMSAGKRAYLISYNALSALLWSVVFGRVVAMLLLRGPQLVYPVVGEWTKWTQTLAALEIVHSLLGVVRAPIMTTAMQVASRFALVWGAVTFYPSVAGSPAYSTMLLAWSSTEVIRYLYFALTLAGSSPRLLFWLRYNTFFVLYPVGITSELAELWLAMLEARQDGDTFVVWAIVATFVIYAPGIPILYGHMMKQRRKMMGLQSGRKNQ